MIVPDRSPVRSARAGATTNNQLKSAAITTRTTDLYMRQFLPKGMPQQIQPRALLPPGQSSSPHATQANAMRLPRCTQENMFLQYVQNVAVSEDKLRRFITR